MFKLHRSIFETLADERSVAMGYATGCEEDVTESRTVALAGATAVRAEEGRSAE